MGRWGAPGLERLQSQRRCRRGSEKVVEQYLRGGDGEGRRVGSWEVTLRGEEEGSRGRREEEGLVVAVLALLNRLSRLSCFEKAEWGERREGGGRECCQDLFLLEVELPLSGISSFQSCSRYSTQTKVLCETLLSKGSPDNADGTSPLARQHQQSNQGVNSSQGYAINHGGSADG